MTKKIVGEYYVVVDNTKTFHNFEIKQVIQLVKDDGTNSPLFKSTFDGKYQYVHMNDVILSKEVEETSLDDLIGKLSSFRIPTEQKERKTNDFTIVYNRQAQQDKILEIVLMYYELKLSLRETASLLQVDEKTIRNRMKRHGVPTRSQPEAMKLKKGYI